MDKVNKAFAIELFKEVTDMEADIIGIISKHTRYSPLDVIMRFVNCNKSFDDLRKIIVLADKLHIDLGDANRIIEERI